ncbi:uncharacterized protein PgNI_07641 [Pyricularia grisea]|uniref:Uncharacterized protein n=1 Tax=Pyricularia grisea TaxID=148305 RepID=A0A6P8B1S9_PYRGI|nr:uncharacterized protein PgNI_07641 [Pyricularia grisea]TLD08817.1 hypothetical protein PgNI_07641 [Pyricularia grisea]
MQESKHPMTTNIHPQKALTACNVNLQRKWVKIDRFGPPYRHTSESTRNEAKGNPISMVG